MVGYGSLSWSFSHAGRCCASMPEMAELLVLRDDEVEALMDLGLLATALEEALSAISRGEVSVPARSAARTPNGLLAAMPGYLEGAGLGAKLVSVYPDNVAAGYPSHQGVILLFDPETGTPSALLGATYITAIRTGMTAAVAARALAEEVNEIAVLGGGVQAQSHLEAFSFLFPKARLRIAARSSAVASALALNRRNVDALDNFEVAVDGADVVCCCTDANEPIFEDRWLKAGCHVSSVGSGREVPDATVDRAEVFVESTAALLRPPAGTAELAGRPQESVTEIGEVLEGRAPGRSSPQAVTLYKSMGHAAEDLAASALVLALASERVAGTTVEI